MKSSVFSFISLLVIIGLSAANAQEDGYLKNHPGAVTYVHQKYDYDFPQKYSPQEEQDIKKKTENFARYLQTYKTLTDVTGFEVRLISEIPDVGQYSKWCNLLYFRLVANIYPWFQDEKGQPVWKCAECVYGFTIYFNKLELIFNGYIMGEEVFDKDGMFLNFEPYKIGELDGCNIYNNGIITITNGKPLWVSVTVKEYNEALISKHQKKLNDGTGDWADQMLIDKVKGEMATMTPKELNSPAYQGDKFGGCPYQLEGARAITKLNKDYFDKSKPRTAIQLIILECSNIQQMENGEYFFTDEYSTPQAIKLAQILKSFKYSDFKKFLE